MKVINKTTIEKKYSIYKTIQIDCECIKCHMILEFTGWVNQNEQFTKYKHICPKCKKIFMLIHQYPYLVNPDGWEINEDILKKLKFTKKELKETYGIL